MRINLVRYSQDYLDHSYEWLHDDEIRRLTDTPVFNREDQIKWFENLPVRDQYLIWGIEFNSIPIGACGLKNITDLDCEYWGYIGEKDYWGLGLGKEMIFLLEKKAVELGKKSIWLKVIKENKRAILLYSNNGFSIESDEGIFFRMRKQL